MSETGMGRTAQARSQRFEQMLARSATAAICAGADNLILSWNSAAEQLFGYSSDEAIGQPLSIIIPPALRPAHEAGLARAVKSGGARLAGQAVEVMAQHAAGHELPVDLSLSMWFEDGTPTFGALLRDVSDRKAATSRLEHLAHCDTLTALPNRTALLRRLHETMELAPCALMMLDLDGFKHVNDSLGHSAGDQLLAEVANRLQSVAEMEIFVARLGGDEFAMLINDCDDIFYVDKVTNSVLETIRRPFELADQSVLIGTSIGIALSPNDAADIDTLLSRADLALYSAKSAGGGLRRFFVPTLQNKLEQRLRLGNELRQGFIKREFELWYQPQFSISQQELLGVEALLRWRHPDHGLLAPNAFINVLSDSVIAEDVGEWILNEACSAAAEWQRQGVGTIRVGVNLFPVQLRSDRLYDVVSRVLSAHNLLPGQLELEITENTVLRLDEPSTIALQKLKDEGVGIAFDDFGTGFASLSLLQQFPLTRLKIDRSFIAQIDDRPGDAAIVRALMCMASTFDLEVIAEGVETVEQEQVLRELGCVAAQGFRYGRPMPAEAIKDLFGRSSSRTYAYDSAS